MKTLLCIIAALLATTLAAGITVAGTVQITNPSFEGGVMMPVDPSNPARGSYRYIFPENDRYQRTFGEEYLYALHMKWKNQDAANPPAIYLDGDSTIIGAYISNPVYLPQNILLTHLRLRGLEANITNRAVSGTRITDFHLSDADINAAQCIIISFGINDTEPVDEFIATYRAKLAHIRSLRSYLQTAIVIRTSNAVGDTTHGRDETQAWPQRKALRQLARDFQCFFFDTAGYIADARNGASGTWNDSVNPSVQLTPGWMDDPFRTDSYWYSPLSFGNTVHPGDIGNSWMWGRLADALAVPGVRNYALNNYQNLGSQDQRNGSELPTAYPYGITVSRAAGSSANWPVDGMVMTVRAPDGVTAQYLTSYDSGTSRISVRTSKVSGGIGWAAWVTIDGSGGSSYKTPVTFTSPTFQNLWHDGTTDGGMRIVKRDEFVYFQGNIAGGTLTPHTLLFTLPAGYAPYNTTSTFVCAGGLNRDEIVVLTINGNGEVRLRKPPTTSNIYLDGVSFITSAGLF